MFAEACPPRSLAGLRSCVAVAAECRQPIGIVTKNALVARDLDLLTELGTIHFRQVNITNNNH